MNIPEHVLKRRVFKKEVNDRLMATTIMGLLDPYVDKDKVSIDVGAAAGHFTYYLASRSKEVWAFEPSPSFDELKKMERLGNVCVLEHAIGNEQGAADFYIDDKRLSNSGFQNLVDGQKVTVSVMPLDAFRSETPIGFVKIDVEGNEFDVINGADQIITKQRPNFLIEIYKPFSAHPLDSIFSRMWCNEYRCFYCINGPKPELVEVKTVEEGVNAVENLHHLHDGDFLFVA